MTFTAYLTIIAGIASLAFLSQHKETATSHRSLLQCSSCFFKRGILVNLCYREVYAEIG
jgi:hypothetical protein